MEAQAQFAQKYASVRKECTKKNLKMFLNIK
jgi:hypothetical protein